MKTEHLVFALVATALATAQVVEWHRSNYTEHRVGLVVKEMTDLVTKHNAFLSEVRQQFDRQLAAYKKDAVPEPALAQELALRKLLARFRTVALQQTRIPLPAEALTSLRLVVGRPESPEAEGECHMQDGLVVLNELVWNRLVDIAKESLVFHELGHCVLGRQHTNEEVVLDGQRIPKSLMTTHRFPVEDYATHRDYYLKELFE